MVRDVRQDAARRVDDAVSTSSVDKHVELIRVSRRVGADRPPASCTADMNRSTTGSRRRALPPACSAVADKGSAVFPWLQVNAGTEFVSTGEQLEECYWVEWGWAELESSVVGSKSNTVAWEVGPGDFIGVLGAATGDGVWNLNARRVCPLRPCFLGIRAAVSEKPLIALIPQRNCRSRAAASVSRSMAVSRK